MFGRWRHLQNRGTFAIMNSCNLYMCLSTAVSDCSLTVKHVKLSMGLWLMTGRCMVFASNTMMPGQHTLQFEINNPWLRPTLTKTWSGWKSLKQLWKTAGNAVLLYGVHVVLAYTRTYCVQLCIFLQAVHNVINASYDQCIASGNPTRCLDVEYTLLHKMAHAASTWSY